MVFLIYIIIALSIVLIDQLAKYFITKKINLGHRFYFFNNKAFITNVRNKGAAYGFLQNNHKSLLFISIFSFIYISTSFIKLICNEHNNKLYKLAYSFLIGGSIGNIYNRIKQKYVVDFICFDFFKKSPIFNVADAFIILGSLLFIIKFILKSIMYLFSKNK